MNANENSPVVAMISLGCPKNTVDSERILAQFLQNGYLLTVDPGEADVCLVNTCGFIESARQEVREVLDELSVSREDTGSPAKIVALGCFVERVIDEAEFLGAMDGVDAMVPFRDYMELPSICDSLLGGAETLRDDGKGKIDPRFNELPRLVTGYPHSAELKISEGCSNACSFCAIPRIRGPQVSRRIEDILAEAQNLIEGGVREICLIAQDTTSYGLDLYNEYALPHLLESLAELETDCWFRLMYAYPPHLSDDILNILAGDKRFCAYIDMPLQHASDSLLTAMHRKTSRQDTELLLERVRAKLPSVAVRTAFIVGYPGETAENFDELMAFVRDHKFDHMGVFTYSPEPGTAAFASEDALSEELKEERKNRLLEMQQAISRDLLSGRVGERISVLVDEVDEENNLAIGRTQQQAPEVDGCTVILDGSHLDPGVFVDVTVSGSSDYDLIAALD